jgi:hypothetical protein
MLLLPQVTVICATTKDYGKSIAALKKTLEQIKPAKTIFFTDILQQDDDFECVLIDRFKSVEDYNHFIFKQLGDYIETSHVLVIQHDGHPLSEKAWTDEFLNYDYIGAPWTYTDGRNVGNGGFSLRSRNLQRILQKPEFEFYSPEDEKIGRYYRQTLELKYGMKFAPEALAHRFSYEMHKPLQPTFGFHNYFHSSYREPVILKRSGAMGDVIMLEPVMEEFYKRGYRVILDTPIAYMGLFYQHPYTIEHIDNIRMQEPVGEYRTIDFDMAYEIKPKQLVLKSYYEIAGITGDLRNSKLKFKTDVKKQFSMFDKYVLLHTDDTAMPHRNVHGVDWDEVAKYIEVFLGYPVFRVGVGNGTGGLKINTYNENMLAYIIANADYFIGIDSGCAQIAVACDVPSMLFFGSVNPKLRYVDFSNIKVMQKHCPANVDGCYHDVVSTVGKDCEVDIKTPPCIKWRHAEIIEQLKTWIK